MGSILCRFAAQRESAETLSLLVPHTRASRRKKKRSFRPLHNTSVAQENDGSEKQKRLSPDVPRESLRMGSDTRVSRSKNRRSLLSPAAKTKLADQTMDDTIPLIEGTKDPTSDDPTSTETVRPKKGHDSVELLPNSDRILNHGDIEISSRSKMNDENDSRLNEEPSRSPKCIHDKRKKRRASKSPLLIIESVNAKDTRTSPNANVPAFFADESSLSSATSSCVESSGASRDQGPSHNTSTEHEKTVPERSAKASSKGKSEVPKNDVKDLGISSTFRRQPMAVAISGQPVQRPLRASAPIFVPKSGHMDFPDSSTQAPVHPKQHTNLSNANLDRIVRLDPNACGVPVLPSLGVGDSSRPRPREMHHWSPSMDSEFQVPRFASWETMREPCNPRRLGLFVDTSAPVTRLFRQSPDGKTHGLPHPTVQRAQPTNASDDEIKPEEQHPAPDAAVQAASLVVRKSPQALSKIVGACQAASASSRPTIFYFKGAKITMIDERQKVFIIDMLSSESCDLILKVRRVLCSTFASTLL
jgi:hypothetical protein